MELNVAKTQTPIYRQLYDQFVRQIVDNTLEADACLPSIRTVARQLNVAVVTVKTAYEMLERDGFIYTLPAKGSFVAPGQSADRKRALAEQRLAEELPYYRRLGLSEDELILLVRKLYCD